MKLKTQEENGLSIIQVAAEDREDTEFLHRFANAQSKVIVILHKDRGYHFPTLTLETKQG